MPTLRARVRDLRGGVATRDVSYSILQPPPPDPSWPNEPAGAVVAIDESFSGTKQLADAPNGRWAYNEWWATSGVSVANGALRFTYGAGFPGGGAPGIASNDGRAFSFTSYYIGFRIRWSLPWTDHPTGTNKIVYWGEGQAASQGKATSQFYLNRRGRYIDATAQWGQGYAEMCLPFDSARTLPSLGCNEKYINRTPVDDGQWHKVECVVNASTNGQPNGRIRMWVDGVHQFELNDVRFAPTGTARFHGLALAPVWGGVGHTKPQTEWLEFDHIRTSGR